MILSCGTICIQEDDMNNLMVHKGVILGERDDVIRPLVLWWVIDDTLEDLELKQKVDKEARKYEEIKGNNIWRKFLTGSY